MSKFMNQKNAIRFTFGLLAIGFGIMTIKSGGLALFGGETGKAFAGKYVAFVLWFNFIAGFFYVIAGVGLFIKKEWAHRLSGILALSTILVFVVFGIFVSFGAEFEVRTVAAMSVRSVFWIFIFLLVKKLKLIKV